MFLHTQTVSTFLHLTGWQDGGDDDASSQEEPLPVQAQPERDQSQHLSTDDAVVLLWLGKGMAEVGNDLFSMLSFFCVNWCHGLAMVAKVLTNHQ